MKRKHRLLWFLLFGIGTLILGSLLLGWNVLLIHNYHKMAMLARTFSHPLEAEQPWTSVTLGNLGLLAALAIIVLFFVKLLKEMKLNQQQAEFLASISHELKTPIAAIELSSSLLQAGDLSLAEEQSLWKTHDEETSRLREEVETLLEAARWEANHGALRDATIQLETWLGSSLERWRGRLGPQAQIERRGVPLDSKLTVDLRTLNLITDNIVDNARKYSRGRPQLTIETIRENGRWKIQFVDRGLGFDPSDSKKIFRRFFRGKNYSNEAIPGTGLGLYLAESAARAMGLQLKGESAGAGHGATFTLEGREGSTR